jgi:hypothetical protein
LGPAIGLTGGVNIAVDVTDPSLPIVSLAITSELNMNQNNIVGAHDIALLGSSVSISLANTSNITKGLLSYDESNDIVHLNATNGLELSTTIGNVGITANNSSSVVIDASNDVWLKAAGDIRFTGSGLESSNAGVVPTGKYLKIILNNSIYKISLLPDT